MKGELKTVFIVNYTVGENKAKIKQKAPQSKFFLISA